MNKNNKLFAEMLSANRKAAQFLHAVYRFNFEMPFGITKLEGRFTGKKLLNVAKAAGYDFEREDIICLSLCPVCGKKFYVLRPDEETGKIWTPTGSQDPWYLTTLRKYGLDWFLTKQTLSFFRREDSCETFLLWQDQSYFTPRPQLEVLKPDTRYIVEERCHNRGYRGPFWSIDVVTALDGVRFAPQTVYSDTECDSLLGVSGVFDASGYYRQGLLANHGQKLRELKHEREVARAIEYARNVAPDPAELDHRWGVLVDKAKTYIKALIDGARSETDFQNAGFHLDCLNSAIIKMADYRARLNNPDRFEIRVLQYSLNDALTAVNKAMGSPVEYTGISLVHYDQEKAEAVNRRVLKELEEN